jgi:hypothetical protein
MIMIKGRSLSIRCLQLVVYLKRTYTQPTQVIGSLYLRAKFRRNNPLKKSDLQFQKKPEITLHISTS